LKKVTNKKTFIIDIKKIAEKNKNCAIFHYYVKKNLFVVCLKEKKYIFNFEDYKNEKTIIKMISDAIELLNKTHFKQLEIYNNIEIKY
jgi:hypothetical protein